MGKSTVRTEALRRAAMAMGGEAPLARVLDVAPEQTRRWLTGEDYPPTEVYHSALDLLIGTGTP